MQTVKEPADAAFFRDHRRHCYDGSRSGTPLRNNYGYGNGSHDPADHDLRMYFVTKSRDNALKLLEKNNAEADASGSYRSNPRYWRENQGAVEDARLFLGEEAERRGDYVVARMWYAEAMAVSDTSTLTATTKLASLYNNGLGGPRDHQKHEELTAMTGVITSEARAKQEAAAAAQMAEAERMSLEQPRYFAKHPEVAQRYCLWSCETTKLIVSLCTVAISCGTHPLQHRMSARSEPPTPVQRRVAKPTVAVEGHLRPTDLTSRRA
jgi:hypothetical protein